MALRPFERLFLRHLLETATSGCTVWEAFIALESEGYKGVILAEVLEGLQDLAMLAPFSRREGDTFYPVWWLPDEDTVRDSRIFTLCAATASRY